ncbi:Agrin [Papilio machaon]|uniref:Agrin n=1 Tax=Papilio machaon TaxID=76193 RepID=A0A0N1IBU2_PAPMA|nr:Agrin [Papilio machaon]
MSNPTPSFSASSICEGARDASCPRICGPALQGDPVCATDGYIYPSLCEMRKKTCGKGVKLAQDLGACSRAQGSKCEHRCTAERDPVCGTNGRTYLNRCMLQVEICRVGIGLSHLGACNNISAHRENCPVDCSQAPLDGPVCGSDGNVYKSTCQMKLLTCGQGVVRTNKKHCQTTRHCRESCWRVARPTCGSDGKLYANACRMKATNCGKHVFEVPMAFCVSQERTSGGEYCPTDCSGQKEKLVCGSDENIYRNECEMKMLNCGVNNRKVVKKVDMEKCKSKMNKCLKVKCRGDFDPVCGTDANVYPNSCQLKVANCLKGVQLAHFGNCTLLPRLETDCPESCDNALDQPVCGSDGNVYKKHVFEVPMAFCVSQERTSGGEYCPTDCSGHKEKLVCGSDENIYRNECEMKMLNCGVNNRKVVKKMDMEKCKSKMNKCLKVKCRGDFDPVCGTDANVYPNSCQLKVANCLKGVQLAHFGNCTLLPRLETDCPESCDNALDQPVCGSDGNVYKSECELRRATCGQHVVAVAPDHCRTTALCHRPCPDTPAFVCGSDNRFYRNECIMKKENCGKHVYVVPLKRCLARFQYAGCARVCPPEYDPVCGTDDKTYSNKCFLEMENCRSRSVVQLKYLGTCTEPIAEEPKNYLYR